MGCREVGVSFSPDGIRVILEYGDVVKRWRITLNEKYSSEQAPGSQSSKSSSEAIPLPMLMIPTSDDVHIIPYDYVRPYCRPMGSE